MTSMIADVAVVGAGPAGVATAITLARAGRRVTIIDKASFPRDKCCGDGLTTGALRRYEALGLDPTTVESWQTIDVCQVRTPNGARLPLTMPPNGQYVAAARRFDLDASFLDVARRAGAHVVEADAVVEVHPDPSGVTLELASGAAVRAWYAVAADGMWSSVRKLTGASQRGYLGEWHAARQYLRDVGPAASDMWVWFEEDLLPGYAWSFPLPNRQANVGYGVLRRSGQTVRPSRQQLEDILTRPHIAEVLGAAANPIDSLKTWPIPGHIGDAALSAANGRVLFVGDAARAADPMTGEGIAQALETGVLAGRAIAQAGAVDARRAATGYQRQVRYGLAIDDWLSRRFSGVLAHTRGANGSVAIAARAAWGRRFFTRWMFEDFPRALPVTPQRWERGLLRRPGPYAPRR